MLTDSELNLMEHDANVIRPHEVRRLVAEVRRLAAENAELRSQVPLTHEESIELLEALNPGHPANAIGRDRMPGGTTA